MTGRSLFLMSLCLLVVVVRSEDGTSKDGTSGNGTSNENFSDAAKKIYGMCCNLDTGLKMKKVKDFANCTDKEPNAACFTQYLMQNGNGEDETERAKSIFSLACSSDSTTGISEMEKIIRAENKNCGILPEAKANKTMYCLKKVLENKYVDCAPAVKQ